MSRILIIDDDQDVLVQLYGLLSFDGHDVTPLINANSLGQELKKHRPDLVISDIMMPGVAGDGVYEVIREHYGPELPIILSSGTALKLKRQDVRLAYCPKPVDFDLLRKTIDGFLNLAPVE